MAYLVAVLVAAFVKARTNCIPEHTWHHARCSGTVALQLTLAHIFTALVWGRTGALMVFDMG